MAPTGRFLCLTFFMAFCAACGIKRVEKIQTAPAKKQALSATREQLFELVGQYAAIQSIKYGQLRVEVQGYYLERPRVDHPLFIADKINDELEEPLA